MLLLSACTADPVDSARESAAVGDTATDTATVPIDDADGDGWPDWRGTSDPATADCDDGDPDVTPDTERFVAAGPFTRGDDLVPHASPVTTITLGPWCLDRLEVTNSEFVGLLRAREEDGSSNVDDAGRPLYELGDDDDTYPERLSLADGEWSIEGGYEDHPVVEVYHWSAELYCASIGKRLATEAEWEKAARGPDDARDYPWGDDVPTCELANHAEGSGNPDDLSPCTDDTATVGSYPDGASPYGVLDLAGNVGEWVSDWFDPEYYASAPDEDPQGPDEAVVFDDGIGSYVARVSRGGGFLTSAPALAVAVREAQPEDATSNGVGFRCARGLTE